MGLYKKGYNDLVVGVLFLNQDDNNNMGYIKPSPDKFYSCNFLQDMTEIMIQEQVLESIDKSSHVQFCMYEAERLSERPISHLHLLHPHIYSNYIQK